MASTGLLLIHAILMSMGLDLLLVVDLSLLGK